MNITINVFYIFPTMLALFLKVCWHNRQVPTVTILFQSLNINVSHVINKKDFVA